MWIGALKPADLPTVNALLAGVSSSVDAQAELARAWSLPWVCRLAGPSAAPVGFLLAWEVADELQLLELVTDPGARRRGVARGLLRALCKHGLERGKRWVLLEVRRSNQAAIALYEGEGFVATGVRRGYYSDNGEDAIEMMLRLDPESGRTA